MAEDKLYAFIIININYKVWKLKIGEEKKERKANKSKKFTQKKKDGYIFHPQMRKNKYLHKKKRKDINNQELRAWIEYIKKSWQNEKGLANGLRGVRS